MKSSRSFNFINPNFVAQLFARRSLDRKLRHTPRLLLLTTLLVILSAPLADAGGGLHAAPAQSSTATLSGMVTDEAGAVIPSVQITVLNLSTALQRHATTNEEGFYAIPLLPPGLYDLTAERKGFATVEIPGLSLNVNAQLALKIKLKVGEIGEYVTIYENVAGLQESAAVGATVTRDFVESLPLNGRSFQSLFELAPGAVLTKTTFNEQGQFSVNGQRANANYFMVDGVSANIGVSAGFAPGQAAGGSLPALTTLGGTNNLVSVDALQEFRIQTSTYAPEFGRTPGAQVSMVTRSGSGEFHGSAFDYFRHDALDANDFFANSRGLRKAPLRQNDFGGVLGGPLLKNGRAFFFFSYEGLRLRQPQVAMTEVPDAAARNLAPASIKSYLRAFPLPNGASVGNGFAEFAATYSDPSRLDATSLRLDTNINERTALFARFNFAPSKTTQRGGVQLPGFSGQSLNTLNRTSFNTQTLTAGAIVALKPAVTNDLRFNWSRASGATALVLDDFGGATPPPDALLFPSFAAARDSGFQFILSGGANSNLGVGKVVDNLQRQLNIVDNLSIVSGASQLKFGIDYRRLTPVYSPLNYNQSVIFGDQTTSGVLAAISTGRASQAHIAAEAAPREPLFTNFSTYVQNNWHASPRLTFTYGVRWELNPPPTERNGNAPYTLSGLLRGTPGPDSVTHSPLALAPRGTPLWHTTYTNFAPRFGGAYQLSPQHGTTLRGGLGLFYDLGNGQSGQGFGSVFPFRNEKTLFDVRFPLSRAQSEPPTLDLNPPFGTIYTFDPQLRMPYTLQWNVALEQALGSRQVISASYVAAVGRRLLRETALLASAPDFTVVRIVTNTATSDYHALQIQFQRRLARGLQAQGFYAWSHSIDDDSDDSSSNFFRGISVRQDRSASNFDVRHSLTAAITYNWPPGATKAGTLKRALFRDWSIDAFVRARTATPVNVAARTGLIIGDLVDVQRPDLIAGVPLYLKDSTSGGGRRINRDAFSVPPDRQGALGRNSLRGFGFSQVDVALRRRFALTEGIALQLRAEFFNLLNHPNFGEPVNDLNNRLFGRSVQMLGRSLGTGGVNGGLSPLYQIGGPRSIQLAVRLQF